MANESARVFAEFFVEEGWIDDVSEFPEINIYFGKGAAFATRIMMADGVTFGRSVLLDPKFVTPDSSGRLNISRSLLVHEIVHVMQYEASGLFRFLAHYVFEFVKDYSRRKKWNSRNWYAAYLEIPYEKEARDAAARFIKWSGNRFRT